MPSPNPWRLICVACLPMLCLLNAGCGSSESGDAAIRDANRTNIQRLTNLYARYQVTHGGRGPNDEVEFRKFITELDPQTLRNIGVDPGKLDSLFLSERDAEPFSIRYAVVGSTRGSNDAVVFEQSGKDGKLQVGFTSLAIRDVDPAEYATLKTGQPASTAKPGSLPPGAGR
jgi:hypothetical protein